MAKAPDFRRAPTHPVQRKGDPGALLETLENAAKFIGLMEPWRQARPYWDRCAGEILKAAKTGETPGEGASAPSPTLDRVEQLLCVAILIV
jgi:hypothetical protein